MAGGASFVYNTAAKEIADGTIAFATQTFKLMLLGTAIIYTPDRDHTFVDMGGASDPIDSELNGVSGYVRGFGGAGRKSISVGGGQLTFGTDLANDRGEIYIADQTWTALGAGDTIDAALLIREITNDAASRLIAYFELANTLTNGGNITLDFDAAEGALRLSTV